MGREDIYSHPSSPNRIHIKRYVKGDVDDPDGVRTVYQARFHSGEDS